MGPKKFFLKIYYLKELQREKERQTEFFHPLVHCPEGCNSQDWARPKLGPRSFIWDSRVGAGPKLGFSQGHQQGLGWEGDRKWSSRDLKWHPCGVQRLRLYHNADLR